MSARLPAATTNGATTTSTPGTSAPPGPGAPTPGPSRTPDLGALARLLTGVVAPTTLLTALLLYYGYVATGAQYRYFGVTLGSLGFSTQDFVMASVAAVYVPLGVLLVVALLLLWGHASVATRIAHATGPHLRALGAGLVVAGVLLLARGIVGVAVPDLARTEPIALTPTCLGVGIGCLAYGRSVLRRTAAPGRRANAAPWTETASLAIVLGLVVVALFWATNSFAAAYGTGRGRAIAERLAQRPAVVLDTTDRLYLAYAGVEEEPLPEVRGQQFHYRYRGLRLLVEANDRLFLVPDSWTPATGAAIVVPVDDRTRVQFYRTP